MNHRKNLVKQGFFLLLTFVYLYANIYVNKRTMKTKIIDHHISKENMAWRELVKYGLPCLSFVGIFISAAHGLASEYPALFLSMLSSTLVGLSIEGRKSIHFVTTVKLISVFLLFVGMTLLTNNPMFVIAGTTLCVVLLIFILRKT